MTMTVKLAAAHLAAHRNAHGMMVPALPTTDTEERQDQSLALQRPEAMLPKRNIEVAALRADGSLFIGQSTAPAIDFFERAFSAFTHGSLVETTIGPVAVEDLQPGDLIQTATGEEAELIWVGTSTFSPADAGKRTALIRIMPDSFGPMRPQRSLTVGPGARILYTPANARDGKPLLAPASKFVDGVNVIKVTPPTPIRLFHICLARHAVIKVDGIEMETYHPGETAPDDVSLSQRDRFISLFPQFSELSDFGPLVHPGAPDCDAH